MEERGEEARPVSAFLACAMPPRHDFRMKLNDAAQKWGSVVGRFLSELSTPLDLVDGELIVAANTPLVASRLSMMGGNIARTLVEHWQLDVRKVKVVVGRRPSPKSKGRRGLPRAVSVQVKEEDVRKLEREYLGNSPDLPEDIVLSLARLQAFFTKRFVKGRPK
jgi:hypothetical protein